MRNKLPKIILIDPPFYRLYKNTYSQERYPLSLGYLAGEIKRKTNWDVMVYNADFYPEPDRIKVRYQSTTGFDNYLDNLRDMSAPVWKEIRQTIRAYGPTVVGISASSQNFAAAKIVAKIAKEIETQTLVILGGLHPTVMGKELLKHEEFDICVKGEGEKTITTLLAALESQSSLAEVKGIAYRENGQPLETPPREFIEDLDVLCFPHEYAPDVLKDYHQYPITAFKNVFALRGCPYNCIFCGSHKIWSRKVRFRSPGNVVKEIKSLQKIGLNIIHFEGDTFGVSKKYINELCAALLKHCPGLKWSCLMHVKLVDESNISIMKKAGCYCIQLGIESGNNGVLAAMRKNITVEEALDACKLIKKHGLELQAFFMFGFPHESEDALRDTLAAMKSAKCDLLIYSIFTPHPGTEIFDFCREQGLIGNNHDYSLYNHNSPANHFCLNIAPERFRFLASSIERTVDRKNAIKRVRRIFSWTTVKRIQELGFNKSLKKGLKILIGQ